MEIQRIASSSLPEERSAFHWRRMIARSVDRGWFSCGSRRFVPEAPDALARCTLGSRPPERICDPASARSLKGARKSPKPGCSSMEIADGSGWILSGAVARRLEAQRSSTRAHARCTERPAAAQRGSLLRCNESKPQLATAPSPSLSRSPESGPTSLHSGSCP